MEESEVISFLSRSASAGTQAILDVYSSTPLAAYKEDRTPVTIADQASHAAIMKILETSSIPVLSEEGQEIPYEVRSAWSAFWLVDPLDGTREYLKGSDEFTINIALIRSGEPVAGIIAQPLAGSGVIAAGGKACKWSRDDQDPGQMMGHRQFSDLSSDVTVIASRSHFDDLSSGFIRKLQNKYARIQLTHAGSALKFLMLADGRADIYPRYQPCMEWDTAAGDAILRATGLGIYDAYLKTPLQYNKKNLLNPSFIAGFRRLID